MTYGSMFKSHILGYPCVIIFNSEEAMFVLNKDQLFKPTFSASKERMLGKQAIFFHQRAYHANLRRLVLRTIMPEAIKDIISEIESIAQSCLKSWEGKYSILNACTSHTRRARKELAQILAQIISTRRNMKQDRNDLLGLFMSEKAGPTDEQIIDNIIGVIFAARDTAATVLTWIVKYLGENPHILEAVTESIIRGKEENGEQIGLNWSDIKNVLMTSRVIQETLRIASILSFTSREAIEDVEIQGYLIPEGWKVLPLFRNIHHRPDNFKEPEKFDPSRFEMVYNRCKKEESI
ncbi:Abscisic acid 8'-hydroxylase 1 [Glycine soja]